MHFHLAGAEFDLPDDWRDSTTYTFLTSDGGALTVECAPEEVDAHAALTRAFNKYGWSSYVLSSRHVDLRRGNGHVAAAVEGEQLALDQKRHLRFVLVAVTAPQWLAYLSFLMPTNAQFMPVVQSVVASARFVGETKAKAPHSPHLREVQAGPVSLTLPADWQPPDGISFLHPYQDEVSLDISIAQPMVLPATIEWDAVISGAFRIVHQTDTPMGDGSNGWETEWSLAIESVESPWTVRKAVIQLNAKTVITALAKGPSSVMEQDSCWALFRRSLRLSAPR